MPVIRSYSVGRSGGALVPVGSSGRRPEGTDASEGYSTIRLFWRALGSLRVINHYCDKLVYLPRLPSATTTHYHSTPPPLPPPLAPQDQRYFHTLPITYCNVIIIMKIGIILKHK